MIADILGTLTIAAISSAIVWAPPLLERLELLLERRAGR